MVDDPIQRAFWQVVKDNLKEINRGVAFSIGQGNSPPSSGVTSHHALTDLTTGDDHTQYLLLAGRTGGQTIHGVDATITALFLKKDVNGVAEFFRCSDYAGAIRLIIFNDGTVGSAAGFAAYNGALGSNSNYIQYGLGGISVSAAHTGDFYIQSKDTISLITQGDFGILSEPTHPYFVIGTGTYHWGGSVTAGIRIVGDSTATTLPTLRVLGRGTTTAALQQWGTTSGGVDTIKAYIDKDGNVNAPGFVLSGGDAYAKKATNETITGQWIFQPTTAGGKTVIKENAGIAGTGYFCEFQDSSGSFLAGATQSGATTPGAFVATTLGIESGGFVSVFSAALTADRVIIVPDLTGTMCLIAATQSLNNKTLTTLNNTLRSNTAASGVAFVDNTTTTKALRFVLSGAVGNNSIVVSSSTARAYTLPDKTGTVPIMATYNNQRAINWQAHDFHSGTSYQTLGTDPAGASGLSMGAVGQTYANLEFRVPDDYVSGGTIYAYVATDGVDTNHYVMKGNYAVVAAGGAVDAAGTALTGATGIPPGTGNKLATPNLGTISVTTGDFVRLTLYRDAADAGDTCADNVIFFGASLIYTADL